MEYKFVQGVNYFDIIAKVEQELNNGWKLAGGISVCAVSPIDVRYTQALTRDPATLATTAPPVLAQMNTEDHVWVPASPVIPVPDLIAPKSDQQKLIDVLTEIGIPYHIGSSNERYSWVDITYEGTSRFDNGEYTTVNFDNGKYEGID